MNIERINDLSAFKSFVEEKLPGGGVGLTSDEALAHWEYENRSAEDEAASADAVRDALDDMRAGDEGIPAREFLKELRHRYGLSARQ